jgi:hypothetical protein
MRVRCPGQPLQRRSHLVVTSLEREASALRQRHLDRTVRM